MAEIAYAEIHAFPDGDRPHSGNPAGVALLEAFLPDADLLGIAQSNNLSETAYLVKKAEADAWDLRWFTPGCEVDLCGHATLASGAVVFERGLVGGDRAAFDTKSGRLFVRRTGEAAYAVEFPAVPFEAAEAAPGTLAALGAAQGEVFEVERIHGARYQMFVYASEAEIAGLNPDFSALKKTGVNVLATARGESADVVSRFFCPDAGIDEDPVTGSAHCTLAPFWAGRLGRTELTARQIGPRPGALVMRAEAGNRVVLTGAAKRYLDGVIRP
ncbi:MAG: PhzF family phenazine biosynthesis protein [Oceanicaulis sp.]